LSTPYCGGTSAFLKSCRFALDCHHFRADFEFALERQTRMFQTFSDTAKRRLATLISRAQAITVTAILLLLMVVVVLSTVHLGYLIAEQMWVRPRFLIPVQGLLEVFGYFLLVLIGVELLETVKMYLKKDVIHVRVVLEVALIAMARKAITEEPASVPSLTLFG